MAIMQTSIISRVISVSALAGVGLTLAVGCSQQRSPNDPLPEPAAFQQDMNRPSEATPEQQTPGDFATYHPAEQTVFPDYRLSINDELEVIYHVRTEIAATYEVKVQDVIDVKFPFQKQFDQSATVQNDGTIRVQLVGTVQVMNDEPGRWPFVLRQDRLEPTVWRQYDPVQGWKPTVILPRVQNNRWVGVNTATNQFVSLENPPYVIEAYDATRLSYTRHTFGQWIASPIDIKPDAPGVSSFHLRQDVTDPTEWRRFNPATRQWEKSDLSARQQESRWVGTSHESKLLVCLEEPAYVIDTYDSQNRRFTRYACNAKWVRQPGVEQSYEAVAMAPSWAGQSAYVKIVGDTAEQIETKLKAMYADYLKRPELTVTVREANIKITELKKAITTAPRGQSRLMPVKPDGTIDLPYIGEVLAFGKTVRELKRDVETAYAAADLPEIDVTVQINHVAPLKIFILGEVRAPGLQTVNEAPTLLQAIAAAGGTNPRADEVHVMVVRRKGLPIPEATIVNLSELLRASKNTKYGPMPDADKQRFNFFLADSDVVYVPPTGLAVAGDWVDLVFNRIIRSVIPYNFNLGLNFGYEIHQAPFTVTNKNSGGPNLNIQAGP